MGKAVSVSATAFIACTVLLAPQQAEAAFWDWLPDVLRFRQHTASQSSTRQENPRYECKYRNTWNKCVLWTIRDAPVQEDDLNEQQREEVAKQSS